MKFGCCLPDKADPYRFFRKSCRHLKLLKSRIELGYGSRFRPGVFCAHKYYALRERPAAALNRAAVFCQAVHRRGAGSNWEDVKSAMQDLTMLLFTVIFFAVAFLYVRACQKLR
jgi:hypothetical protein